MKACTLSACLFLLSILCSGLHAAAPTAVPTFECLGIYWKSTNGSSTNTCSVEYRETGASTWNDALPLWWDDRTDPDFGQEYRGSIVNLSAGTDYDIRLTLDSGQTETFTASTWSDDFPIAEIVTVSSTNQRLVISEGGDANGYVLYTAPVGQEAVIDVNNNEESAILIESGVSHVIIRGLTIENPGRHGIMLGDENWHSVSNIVIEDCDISGWGKFNPNRGGLLGYNLDSAVYSKSSNVERIIIQGNRIHHPKTTSNSWDNGHPKGPQGITFENLELGGHVIRYNDFYSDDDHYFNDAMGEVKNFSHRGFPNRDSDIYGNRISHCWDDGIEAEGRNENVRIWGNYIDRTYVKIAIAPVSVGPTYVWRNVGYSTAKSPDVTWRGGTFFKAGGEYRGSTFMGGGKTYLFHNTALTVPGSEYGATSAAGIGDSGVRDIINHDTRNNIFKIRDSSETCIKDHNQSATNSFDYDLYKGSINAVAGSESNGIDGTATYVSTWGFNDATSTGVFNLDSSSLGFDDGEVIPNFNEGYNGSAPDMGAHEGGEPPLQYGVFLFPANNENPFATPFSLYNNGTLIRTGAEEMVGGVSGIDPPDANGIDADAMAVTTESSLEALPGFIALQGFESFGRNTSADDIIDFDSNEYPDIRFNAYGSASANSHGVSSSAVTLNTSEGSALQFRNNSGSPKTISLEIDFGDYASWLDYFDSSVNAVGAVGFVLTQLDTSVNAAYVDYYDTNETLITTQSVTVPDDNYPDVYFGYDSVNIGISKVVIRVNVPSGVTVLGFDDLGFAPVSLPTLDYDIYNGSGYQVSLDAVGVGPDAIDPDGVEAVNRLAVGAATEAALESSTHFIAVQSFDGFGSENNDPNIIDFVDPLQPDIHFTSSGSAAASNNGNATSSDALNTSEGTAINLYNNSGSNKTLTLNIDFGDYDDGLDSFDGSAKTVDVCGFSLQGVSDTSLNISVEFKDSSGTILSTQTAQGGANDNVLFGYDSQGVGIAEIRVRAFAPGGVTSLGLDDLGFTSATQVPAPLTLNYDIYDKNGYQNSLNVAVMGEDAIDPSGAETLLADAMGSTAEASLEALPSFLAVQSFDDFNDQSNDPNIVDFIDPSLPDISFNASGSASGNHNGKEETGSAFNTSAGTSIAFYNNSGSNKTLTQTINFGSYDAGADTFDGAAKTVRAAAFCLTSLNDSNVSITVEFKNASGTVIETQTASGGAYDNIYFGHDSGSVRISEIRIVANVPSGITKFGLDDVGFAP